MKRMVIKQQEWYIDIIGLKIIWSPWFSIDQDSLEIPGHSPTHQPARIVQKSLVLYNFGDLYDQ